MKIPLRFLALRTCATLAGLLLTWPAVAQDWTSFRVAGLSGFAFTHAHTGDGRFVFGAAGSLSVQDIFGATAFTQVDNSAGRTFDPSFVVITSGGVGLVGGGGFFAPTGLFPFDPGALATPVGPAVATLQNYAATYWKHPTTGREGWLIAGGNGVGGANNLTFISLDGTQVGAVTGVLSAYSGGIAADGAGRVFVALADFNPAVDNRVLSYSPTQIDTAVAAVMAGTPTPLAKAAASEIFVAAASGALAVDGAGRLWLGGYQIDHLQAHDPANGVTRRFFPDHGPLAGAAGPTSYAPRAFTHAGEDFVSFLANDSYYTSGSDLLLGYRRVSELALRSVQFTQSTGSAREDDGTVSVTVTITPAPTTTVRVPLIVSGTATPGSDFDAPEPVTFAAGETSRTINLILVDDATAREPDETLILKLDRPTPESEAGLGAPGTDRFTLTVADNDVAPKIADQQALAPLKAGSTFSHAVTMDGGGDATRWSARGLPPGLRIDPKTGEISGNPTVPGQYDRVVIYAANAFGQTASRVLFFNVEPVTAMAVGTFQGLLDRTGPESAGLGGRIDLVTTAGGAWSAVIVAGGARYRTRGRLDTSGADPILEIPLSQRGILHTLRITISAADGSLSGGFVGGGAVTGWRAAGGLPPTGLCHYWLAVQGGPATAVPEGTGFGLMRFGKSVATGLAYGRLADGSAFASAGWLGPQGEIPVFQGLYRLTGSLLGTLQTIADPDQAVVGSLDWSKAPQLRGTLYRGGWAVPLPLAAQGGRYRPVDGATLPLDAAPGGADNATLTLQDAGLDAWGVNPRTFSVRISGPNQATLTAPHRLTIRNASGLFQGFVGVADANGVTRRVPFVGLLVPVLATADPFDTVGHGYFFLATVPNEIRSGLVLLERNP
ncbi:MAG: putative Ig domain-containing protein [Verrucomicrobiales bacterium]|nr:putative Ig domain-containing protein [Verrucomicrobiales bacterium]